MYFPNGLTTSVWYQPTKRFQLFLLIQFNKQMSLFLIIRNLIQIFHLISNVCGLRSFHDCFLHFCSPGLSLQYKPTFEKQYPENNKSKWYLHQHLFGRISDKLFNNTQFGTICTCDPAVLMFKVYGNFGILKIEFFKFSRAERVKQNHI